MRELSPQAYPTNTVRREITDLPRPSLYLLCSSTYSPHTYSLIIFLFILNDLKLPIDLPTWPRQPILDRLSTKKQAQRQVFSTKFRQVSAQGRISDMKAEQG